MRDAYDDNDGGDLVRKCLTDVGRDHHYMTDNTATLGSADLGNFAPVHGLSKPAAAAASLQEALADSDGRKDSLVSLLQTILPPWIVVRS